MARVKGTYKLFAVDSAQGTPVDISAFTKECPVIESGAFIVGSIPNVRYWDCVCGVINEWTIKTCPNCGYSIPVVKMKGL